MTKILKIVGILIAGVVVGLLISAAGSNQSFGGVYSQTVKYFDKGIDVGPSGTLVSEMITGTCTLTTTTLPHAATSTEAYSCTAAGVSAGDHVFVTLPSNNGSIFGGFVIDSAVASTNSITVNITNLTGTATSTFPAATTTVPYWVVAD